MSVRRLESGFRQSKRRKPRPLSVGDSMPLEIEIPRRWRKRMLRDDLGVMGDVGVSASSHHGGEARANPTA